MHLYSYPVLRSSGIIAMIGKDNCVGSIYLDGK